MKKTAFFLLIALLSAMPAFAVKYVAVVESEIDARSGAAAELTPAEVAVITTELRREAVKNLPRDKYNIMTTETVIAQGSAVLEECFDENCVIALGSKIGADYIVRGTITKFQTLFILSVEIYETEDGNLVASSDPVRSEDIRGLLEKAAPICAEMFKTFAKEQTAVQKPEPKPEPEPMPEPKPEPKSKPKPEPKPKPAPKPKPEPKPKQPRKPIQWPAIKTSAGGGALFAAAFGGGLKFRNGERAAMPYYGGGAYLFFDAAYAEVSAGFSTGGGKWESADVPDNRDTLPDMPRSYINICAFAKYPVAVGNIKIFPLAGIDYEASVSGKLKFANGYEYLFDGERYGGDALSALWFKFGGGFDAGVGQNLYVRAEFLYGFRTANTFEKGEAGIENAETRPGTGLTVRGGVGVKF
jgi:cell division septation protein DedD